ncbi:MAG TPA: DNA repair protein RecO [Acidimicrobiales bacterium]|nr:DNA repair protein RecO [Acidimicrobiales bacterium]
MAHFSDEGIALRAIRLGETDRIVTFLTRENGKVRAVAKGVRRPKNRIGARVEPLSHVTMMCWRGRDLDTISQVELLESFRAIRSDLDRMGPAITMLEIVDQVALERHESAELFTMLLGALRALENRASPVLLGAFCFKLLALEGVGPIVEHCVNCEGEGPFVAFDASAGGLLCIDCRRGQSVSGKVVDYLQILGHGGLARLLEEPSGQASIAFERLGIETVEHHLGRRLRSAHSALEGERSSHY